MFPKKRSPRSRTSNRFLTKRQANRTFKHAVREKVICINVKCQQICTEPGGVCPNGGKHILVANAEVHGTAGTPAAFGFNDAMRITKLEGTLWMRPDYGHIGDAGANCQEIQTLLRRPTIFRMGLVKSRAPQTLGGIPVAVNPLSDGVDPFHLSDATDQPYLKTWNHLFQVQDTQECGFTTQNTFGVGTSGYIVPPTVAAENPGWIVPPDVCITCENQIAGSVASVGVRMPGFHPFHINYRRPIVLKENDNLDLFFGWECMRPCDVNSVREAQPPMITVGHVFMTVEH